MCANEGISNRQQLRLRGTALQVSRGIYKLCLPTKNQRRPCDVSENGVGEECGWCQYAEPFVRGGGGGRAHIPSQ